MQSPLYLLTFMHGIVNLHLALIYPWGEFKLKYFPGVCLTRENEFVNHDFDENDSS